MSSSNEYTGGLKEYLTLKCSLKIFTLCIFKILKARINVRFFIVIRIDLLFEFMILAQKIKTKKTYYNIKWILSLL